VQIQERDIRKKQWEQLDDDFEYAPFAQEGGLGKVYPLFGDGLKINAF
jgi:hypothetical protein